ncbi:hypothetical protein [Fluviispira sanaruensis]|uniref:Uncharacterized protein n=1 Tax=Fluviispira sanaruensis TaxID=2493639 RepID=A0A4P2VMA6_FLUSA|nr:hypothetical protein [Fluviispira sanaruensis]BBH53878.1 hypothetical protein JCM31447_23310 [Fluviispira sanaruensis]
MDIQSFFDVALAFKGGGNNITSFPINFENSVVAISFIFCLIMFTVLSTIINNDSENFLKILPIFVMIYAVESYFIGRSHENNHLNLLPLTIVGIVFLVEIWKSNNDKYKWIPIAIIPVISIICINAINFSNKNFFSYLRNLESIFSVSENFRKSQYKAYGALIDIKIPEDTAVGMITNTHGYISPTLYLNENDKTNYQLLIPGPSYITALLSSERRKLHIRRFINKIKSRNGLIVIEKKLLREEVTIDILETLKESFDLYKEVSTNEFDYFYFRKKEREDKKLIN